MAATADPTPYSFASSNAIRDRSREFQEQARDRTAWIAEMNERIAERRERLYAAGEAVRPDVFIVEGSDPPVLCLVGDCDLALRDHLSGVLADLARSGATRLIVDMEHMTFMDSTVIGMLAAKARDTAVTLRNVPEKIDRVLETARVYDFVERA